MQLKVKDQRIHLDRILRLGVLISVAAALSCIPEIELADCMDLCELNFYDCIEQSYVCESEPNHSYCKKEELCFAEAFRCVTDCVREAEKELK